MSRIDLPGYGIATTPDYPPAEACANDQCRADGVEIDENGYCPTCRPHDEETAEPFTVMATIHGPVGWYDVVDTKQGHAVAVCPAACFARKIARLLAGARS